MGKALLSRHRHDIWVDRKAGDPRDVTLAVAALRGLDPRAAAKLVESGAPIVRNASGHDVRFYQSRFAAWGVSIRLSPESPALRAKGRSVAVREPHALTGPWAWPLEWTLVYALNLPVPWILGNIVMEGRGRLGIGAAVALYWALGLAVGLAYPPWGRRLVQGGMVVGITSATFVGHIGAGMVASVLVSALGQLCRIANPRPELDGFMMTLATGGELLILALLIGRLADPLASTWPNVWDPTELAPAANLPAGVTNPLEATDEL